MTLDNFIYHGSLCVASSVFMACIRFQHIRFLGHTLHAHYTQYHRMCCVYLACITTIPVPPPMPVAFFPRSGLGGPPAIVSPLRVMGRGGGVGSSSVLRPSVNNGAAVWYGTYQSPASDGTYLFLGPISSTIRRLNTACCISHHFLYPAK